MQFKDITIGQCFILNGTVWCKKSSRTAYLNSNDSRWFYFGLKESVKPCY